MYLTFGFLSAAVLSTWIPGTIINSARVQLRLWHFLLAAAVVSGLAARLVSVPAVVTVALLFLLCQLSVAAATPLKRRILEVAAAIVALAMAMHLLPGFANPKLYDAIVLSPLSAPLTVYLNFDKAVAGMMLVAYLCRKIESRTDAARVAPAAIIYGVATTTAVIALGLVIHYIALDVKGVEQTITFLFVNVVFAVIAEEAFFRGVIQERLHRIAGDRTLGYVFAVLLSAILFGLVHGAGGAKLVALATVAGVGYAAVYAKTRSVEASIFVHALLNTVHFALFTYPYAI